MSGVRLTGQALAKFASVVLAAHDMMEDKPLAQAGLGQLIIAFARFGQNKQKYPLTYECKSCRSELGEGS